MTGKSTLLNRVVFGTVDSSSSFTDHSYEPTIEDIISATVCDREREREVNLTVNFVDTCGQAATDPDAVRRLVTHADVMRDDER